MLQLKDPHTGIPLKINCAIAFCLFFRESPQLNLEFSMNIKKPFFSQQRLRRNKFWRFAILSISIAILIAICPATAQAAGTTISDTDFLINICRISIEILLVIGTIVGIIVSFIGTEANIKGLKSFLAYGPCLRIFFFTFLVSFSWELIIGPFDLIIIGLGVLNASLLLSFLLYAWSRSSLN